MFLSCVSRPTTQEVRAELQKAGFVHVTGLKLWGPTYGDRPTIVGKDLPAKWIGRWDQDGNLVLVTEGGEVWWAHGSANPPEGLLYELCPHGRGANVPTSGGKWFWSDDVAARLVDPDWDPRYGSK